MGNPTRFNAYTSSCRALSLCRGLAMNVHVVRNPTFWYGHTPYYGVMINTISCIIPALWRGDQWMMIRQPHRGCTFDSPGLPTIGGYPGERGGGNDTPLGIVLSFYVLSNTSHVTIRGIAHHNLRIHGNGHQWGNGARNLKKYNPQGGSILW